MLYHEKALIVWKNRLRDHWGEVRVESVTASRDKMASGEFAPVKAIITLGNAITPDDVAVQLYSGPVDTDRKLVETHGTPLTLEGSLGSGRYTYTGALPSDKSGQLGFTVRVLPSHPDAVLPQELALIAWE